MQDAVFGMQDSSVRSRCWIGLNNVRTRECVEIEVCDASKTSSACDNVKTWENGILTETKTPPKGYGFLPLLHLKCARLCVPQNDLLLMNCLSLRCSPLDLCAELDQRRWWEGGVEILPGC